jgi:peptidoglycan/xylan/chitin deacetylase (PgdA/CDA1 family)
VLGLGAAAFLSACGGAQGRPGAAEQASPVESGCRGATTKALPGGSLQEGVACDAGNAMDIALTIDDGPHPEWTPPLLTLLAQHHVLATFCVVGRNAAKHPDLVAAAVAGGHRIANHTQTHATLADAPAAQVRAEIEQANASITKAAGQAPTLFRAPSGKWTPEIFEECRRQGLQPLGWSVDPRDWSRPGTDAIVQALMTRTRPGSIILEHDGGGDRSQTLQALSLALPRLLDAGYRFVQP